MVAASVYEYIQGPVGFDPALMWNYETTARVRNVDSVGFGLNPVKV